MTPRVDAEVLDARLRELSRRLKRLAAKKPASLRRLLDDEDLQDIIARNLELAIRACIDVAMHLCGAYGVVPTSSGEAFSALADKKLIPRALAQRLRRAVGFRNVLVHDYVEVDWKIVQRVLEHDAADLAAFGKSVLKLIED
ncbi:MAG TPA: DUF86 domain-containing protein [Burkholderiales bacterium]|nr:DUF86 domain-containing protein [Burkholderiales bacterium]